MAYQVIARKWRPQVFEDIIGQPHITQTLINSIKQNRIGHAFIFTGIRGVGKTSAARILAKSLNCQTGITITPCNKCSNCNEVTNGNSVDVIEIDGASNNGVDQIRDLQERINYLPAKSKFKIYIIDEVHMLSTAAFNALLKTLEEPPVHVKFIFATTEINQIPATILSRCQRFDFRKISEEDVGSRLKSICVNEGIEADLEDLCLLAKETGGSMRDAQSILDQIICYSGNIVKREDIYSVLGMFDRSKVFKFIYNLLKNNLEEALTVVAEVDSLGHSMKKFNEEVLKQLRNLMLFFTAGRNSKLLDLSEEEKNIFEEIKSFRNSDEIAVLFTIFMKATQEMHFFEDLKLYYEILTLKASSISKMLPIDTLLSSINELKKKTLNLR